MTFQRHDELSLMFKNLGYQVSMSEVDEILQASNTRGHITLVDFKNIMFAEDEEEEETMVSLKSSTSMPTLESSNLYPSSKALFSKRVFSDQTSTETPSSTRFNLLHVIKRLPFWRSKDKKSKTIEVQPKKEEESRARASSMRKSPGISLKIRKRSISQSVPKDMTSLAHSERRPIPPRNSIKVLREAFAVFDTDNDGVIGKTDMKSVMERLGLSQIMTDNELDQLYSCVDLDHDGMINFNEFVELFFMK